MPYLVDLLIGAILTVLALFIIDHGNALRENLASEPQKIINADIIPANILVSCDFQ
jgi:hypothetical protein